MLAACIAESQLDTWIGAHAMPSLRTWKLPITRRKRAERMLVVLLPSGRLSPIRVLDSKRQNRIIDGHTRSVADDLESISLIHPGSKLLGLMPTSFVSVFLSSARQLPDRHDERTHRTNRTKPCRYILVCHLYRLILLQLAEAISIQSIPYM